MWFIGFGRCPNCDSDEIRRARVRYLTDVFALLVLLRPVRCYECMRRHFAPFWVRVKKHSSRAEPKDDVRRIA